MTQLKGYGIMIHQWWWLSFSRPNDKKGFLGACIVKTHADGDILTAATVARSRGLNPGGEVLAIPLSEEPEDRWKWRLLDRQDCDEYGATDHDENMRELCNKHR